MRKVGFEVQRSVLTVPLKMSPCACNCDYRTEKTEILSITRAASKVLRSRLPGKPRVTIVTHLL
jgi:hypothetical protein